MLTLEREYYINTASIQTFLKKLYISPVELIGPHYTLIIVDLFFYALNHPSNLEVNIDEYVASSATWPHLSTRSGAKIEMLMKFE